MAGRAACGPYPIVCGAAVYCANQRSASSRKLIGGLYAAPCSTRHSCAFSNFRAAPFVATVSVLRRLPSSRQ
jgi:hypothetical protein